MARTARRRRRKHRGTQGGSIDRRGRGPRPRSRQEARARARRQVTNKRDLPPTWSGAMTLAMFGAAMFLLLLVLLFRHPFGPSLGIAAAMFVLYTPMGYYMQRFLYRRRQAQMRRQRERDARGG